MEEWRHGLQRLTWLSYVGIFLLGFDQNIPHFRSSVDIGELGSYVSFDLMAELVFGKAFHMLDLVDNRFIIDLIQVAAYRVGVCLQMPRLAVWNVDKLFTPSVRTLRDQYVAVSKKLAIERMNMDSKRQDLFSHILAAKDPQTGKGFSMDEIWGESTLLIVAGNT